MVIEGLAANSVNGIITVIQSSLKLAYTLGELKEYTADKIKRPKTKEKEVSCFTLPQQKKIEQAVLTSKKPKLFGIVLCLYSGLRIGELLALEWSDIDFNKGAIAEYETQHALVKLGLYGEKSVSKFIPKEYLTASVQVRKDLLDGLLDTDGHKIKDDVWEYNTSSERLANDFAELSRS